MKTIFIEKTGGVQKIQIKLVWSFETIPYYWIHDAITFNGLFTPRESHSTSEKDQRIIKTDKKISDKHPGTFSLSLTVNRPEHKKWNCSGNVDGNIQIFPKMFSLNSLKKKRIAVFEPTISCVRDRDHTTVPQTQVTQQIFILNQIHASVISQILWIDWIKWKFCSIQGKTPLACFCCCRMAQSIPSFA